MRAYELACMRVQVHACMSACVYACLHRACVHACIRACPHAYMRACIHVCMRAWVYTYIALVALFRFNEGHGNIIQSFGYISSFLDVKNPMLGSEEKNITRAD